MPNWVKNKISFEGQLERIEEMLAFIKTTGDDCESYIDFNKIVPMPESLNIVSGGSTDTGISLVKYLSGDDSLFNEMLKYGWVKNSGIKTTNELFEYLKSQKNYQELVDIGKRAIYNVENYGHTDWYSWCCDKWGTKWNSCRSSLDENNLLTFETAWSNPYPVLVELSIKFPDIKFTVEYADEDIGSNCGKYALINGEEFDYEEYDGIKSCEVWNYDPADYFPEFFRDKQIDKIIGDE